MKSPENLPVALAKTKTFSNLLLHPLSISLHCRLFIVAMHNYAQSAHPQRRFVQY